ncbi:MAG: hypothetical protein GY816_08475 [Cytophagales bacterium]|nr:hypothetical protein [Cytophagales bacterium]
MEISQAVEKNDTETRQDIFERLSPRITEISLSGDETFAIAMGNVIVGVTPGGGRMMRPAKPNLKTRVTEKLRKAMRKGTSKITAEGRRGTAFYRKALKSLRFKKNAVIDPAKVKEQIEAFGGKLTKEQSKFLRQLETRYQKSTVVNSNPPINRARQQLHVDGTPGKSQFKQGINADDVTRTAWEQGVPEFNKHGQFLGKRFTFKKPIGISPTGHDQYSIFVHWSRTKGIHGVPTTIGVP